MVTVGSERKTYVIHKSFVKSSAFLAAALTGKWQEAKAGTVSLNDVETKHFDRYVHWLYSGRILLDSGDVIPLEPAKKDDSEAFLFGLDLYVLGYYLLDRRFRDSIVDCLLKLVKGSSRYPDRRSIYRIWDKTPEISPMKTLIVDCWAQHVRARVGITPSSLNSTCTITTRTRRPACAICKYNIVLIWILHHRPSQNKSNTCLQTLSSACFRRS